MVCDLTLGKEKWGAGWSAAEEVQAMCIPLLNRAGDLATEDSDAFDAVMASFGLPKSTDEEKGARTTAIRER